MPRNYKFTKEEIIKAAVGLVREKGFSSLTARSLSGALNSSSKPIFSVFNNMESLQNEVIKKADEIYNTYLSEKMKESKYPPYKASGMAYIRFAKEERELFKLLFMRDRSAEEIPENKEEIRPIIDIIMKNLKIGEEKAYKFHMEMWVFVHGIAAMISTGFLNWSEDFTSKSLTDAYSGLKLIYEADKK